MKYTLSSIRCVSAAIPMIRPGDVQGNVEAMIALAARASEESALVVFPELSCTGATCADVFLQKRLLDECNAWITEFLDATRAHPTIYVIGAPMRTSGCIYNVAYVACAGQILGVVPKRTLSPEQTRCFTPAPSNLSTVVVPDGSRVPFGHGLLFQNADNDTFRFTVDVGGAAEADLQSPALLHCWPIATPSLADVWPPLSGEALVFSRRTTSATLIANAGSGESSSSASYAGDSILAFDGTLLREGPRHAVTPLLTSATIDFGALDYRRTRAHTPQSPSTDPILFTLPPAPADSATTHTPTIDPHPFVPSDRALCDARCAEVFAIQTSALATRLRNTGIQHVILGLSGGLDSTLALLVCYKAFLLNGLDPDGIHLFTLPGFGTGERTRSNAYGLAEGLDLPLEEISIVDACTQHLNDLGHDLTTADATYENAQARERTQILMDKANQLGGLVIGTGDLSELALGWCTFGGDQLSMYAVNADVPKTLIQAVVSWASREPLFAPIADSLRAVVDTPISPELLPVDESGDFAQKTEEVVGPYELHDFFLYHFLRNGAEPTKIRALALCAFKDTYPPETIDHWLSTFLKRFFSQQFKRIASPEAPQILSISLDPRSNWSMPGDLRPSAWL